MSNDGKSNKNPISLFDKHHVINRFSLLLSIGSLLTIGGCVQSHLHLNSVIHKNLMTVNQAGSTSSFSISTNTQITLGNSYLSRDQKTAFVPLTFNNMNNVGIIANGYRIYAADTSGSMMNYKVQGHLYLYGSSGKAVIVLRAPKRILNEPLQMFLLNKKHISSLNLADADNQFNSGSDQTDGSSNDDDAGAFGSFDVAPFRINPASYDIQRDNRMPNVNSDPSLQQVYRFTFTNDLVNSVKNVIQSDKDKIKQYSTVSNNLIQRLTQQGYKVPGEPVWMEDDWRPYNSINLDKLKTANGKHIASYNPVHDTDKDLNQVKFADRLVNRNGTKTGSSAAFMQNSNSSSQDTNSDGEEATDSPAQEWANLQNVWTKIESLKRDIYVVQPYKIYGYHKDELSYVNQGSIGSLNNFKQVSN